MAVNTGYYFDPKNIFNTNVLSISGGGVRGLIPGLFLDESLRKAGISYRDFIDGIDVIDGSSIGGILSLALANGESPERFVTILKSYAKKIFPEKAGWSAWADFVWRGNPLYSRDVVKQLAFELFGDRLIKDLKKKVVITTVRTCVDEGIKSVWISNIPELNNLQDFQESLASEWSCVDAVLATSAAPVYFGGYERPSEPSVKYYDGGLIQNNPWQVALGSSLTADPLINRQCVLSLGTGFAKYTVPPKIPRPRGVALEAPWDLDGLPQISLALAMATSCPEESSTVELMLSKDSDFNKKMFYYRFNPLLHYEDTDLDNADPIFIQYMGEITKEGVAKDWDNINQQLIRMMSKGRLNV